MDLSNLSPEALELKRAIERERSARYREKNREKYNAYQRAYRKKNAQRIKEGRLRLLEKKAAAAREQGGEME